MRRVFLTVMAGLLSITTIAAENLLSRPESVAYDSINHRYLVASIGDASIIEIDTLGNQTPFKEDLGTCYSNHLDGNIMYFSSGSYVRGLDRTTAEEVFTVYVAYTGGNLDGITTDTSGNLYAVDPNGGQIFIIDIASQTSAQFVTSGLPSFPQDVTFDATHNRLYLCSFASSAPILAFNLPNPTPVEMTVTPFGQHDGIITDGEGNIFLSAAGQGAIYRYDSAFSELGELIIDGLDWPTGMDYNRQDCILAIPTFEDDSITFLDLSWPNIELIGRSITESSGDGDGSPDTNETIRINATIHNYRQRALDSYGELISGDPYISITTPVAEYDDTVQWGGEGTTQTPFEMSILPSCPDSHIALLELTTHAQESYNTVDTILLFIGNKIDFGDNCESGEGFWKHKSLTSGCADDWHLDDFRSTSETNSWKMGGTGSLSYSNNSDGALVTPPFMLSTNSILRLSHWINAEAMLDGARDGGIVYLITAAGDMTQISPEGGYPNSFFPSPNPSIPEGVPCFSGSHDWQTAEFDLSEFNGVVQILFRFASNGANNREGWYLDDIEVVGDPLYTCGDANGDEAVNVGDAVYLANFVFRNADCVVNPPIGCPPDPEDAGDINCDGNVNIGDAVYLVNFVFKEGAPEPCASCP